MKKIVDHPVLGHIEYKENSFTGSKSLSLNGAPLKKTSKNTFVTAEGMPVAIKGNYLTGSTLVAGEESVRLVPAVTWYEWALCVSLFLFVIIWGNIPSLCAIVPLVGGAIGGMVSGVMCVCAIIVSKLIPHPALKIIVILAMAGAAFLINFGIGSAIIAML